MLVLGFMGKGFHSFFLLSSLSSIPPPIFCVNCVVVVRTWDIKRDQTPECRNIVHLLTRVGGFFCIGDAEKLRL